MSQDDRPWFDFSLTIKLYRLSPLAQRALWKLVSHVVFVLAAMFLL